MEHANLGQNDNISFYKKLMFNTNIEKMQEIRIT